MLFCTDHGARCWPRGAGGEVRPQGWAGLPLGSTTAEAQMPALRQWRVVVHAVISTSALVITRAEIRRWNDVSSVLTTKRGRRLNPQAAE